MKLLKPLEFPDGSVQVAASMSVQYDSVILPPYPFNYANEGVSPALAVKAGRVRLTDPIRVTTLAFQVSTNGGTGSTTQFAIYNVARELVIESGLISAASNGRKTWVFAERIFQAGEYYLAWTFSNTTAQMLCSSPSQGVSLFDEGPRFHGIVANMATATAMPRTLGAFTSAPFVGAFPYVQLYR